MKVPFICNACEGEEYHEAHPIQRVCSNCAGVLEINYRNNYEKVAEIVACNTCVHSSVGNGEKCNYCNQI